MGYFLARPLLLVSNRHVEGSPIFEVTGETPKYTSYFENVLGEQWVFQSGEGTFSLSGGDIGWAEPITTMADLGDLVLQTPEILWVAACLYAAKLDCAVDFATQRLGTAR